ALLLLQELRFRCLLDVDPAFERSDHRARTLDHARVRREITYDLVRRGAAAVNRDELFTWGSGTCVGGSLAHWLDGTQDRDVGELTFSVRQRLGVLVVLVLREREDEQVARLRPRRRRAGMPRARRERERWFCQRVDLDVRVGTEQQRARGACLIRPSSVALP